MCEDCGRDGRPGWAIRAEHDRQYAEQQLRDQGYVDRLCPGCGKSHLAAPELRRALAVWCASCANGRGNL